MQAYQQYLELTRNNKPISNLREENLLLKPVTQMALAHVALMAQRKGINWESAVGKLNQIDWSFNNDLWFNILVIGSANKKMITGKDSIRSAGMVIAYMVMGKFNVPIGCSFTVARENIISRVTRTRTTFIVEDTITS